MFLQIAGVSFGSLTIHQLKNGKLVVGVELRFYIFMKNPTGS